IEEAVVRIAPGLATAPGEVHVSRGLIDGQQITHDPGAARYAVSDRACRRVDEIEVSPAVALGPPDYLLPTTDRTPVRDATGVLVRLDERLPRFLQDGPRGAS